LTRSPLFPRSDMIQQVDEEHLPDLRLLTAGLDGRVLRWDPYDMSPLGDSATGEAELSAMTFHPGWGITITGGCAGVWVGGLGGGGVKLFTSHYTVSFIICETLQSASCRQYACKHITHLYILPPSLMRVSPAPCISPQVTRMAPSSCGTWMPAPTPS
jgi:hypothetical protein